ncbi:restriction endonuclease subunit S [Mycoplasmopsis felis]|uniref:restriction endonuclease subunit S n=1 Tax=Mycoplasmopsis felis TaxID=33923 RepID=UPI002AFE163C|nr:restriction endonuclease subunit S [Mycoplasmopsis felis]WQQ06727.1 restriction endonuclease subunit S [Mycoplasmopsis felis]WQQ09746.1 restriction endonuclease subunit S [Mycoplasmopsis felis]
MKKVLVPKVRFKGFDNNWEQGNIGEVFELTRGEVLSQRKIRNKKMGEYIYPVFSSQTLNNGLLGFYNNFLFKNSITWTTDGANAGTVLYRDGLFYATNVCGVMLQKTSIKPSSYFAHEINVKVKKHVIKAGNPKLMINVLHEVLINFSKNKLEQEKISILIENIDNLITLEQTKLNKLKQLKETLLQKMFPEHNSKTPRIRFKGFNEEWKEEKLEYIAKVTNGKSNTSDNNKWGQYNLYIRSEEIYKSNKYIFDVEGVITVGDGNIGKIFHYVNGKFDLHQRCYLIYEFQNIWPKYFYYYFSQNFYKRAILMSYTATVNSIRMNTITDMDIMFPKELIEQQKIGNFFSKIDNLISLYQSKLKKLKKIKEALLQKMFV